MAYAVHWDYFTRGNIVVADAVFVTASGGCSHIVCEHLASWGDKDSNRHGYDEPEAAARG
jgi:hypothetical protein